ncbi:alpha/beta fold hydrolase [Aminobacter sp. NyZ550]|jgi:pimeloyl-ACP methyl ester carboxylesterase|uniref:Hydrolase n=2 Tax=Aminobacter TaxID=31988 RepID=A0AAC9FDN0_AMIAI|nr:MULTISPECIES: alpha/beta hydrolase [Aminobacter]AMS42060.1 Hydrolase [Aminobacter aminovorans]MBA8906118.1 pimeloyl-ACP methyl ester carboxylesterase [Aminobacter ciceronei]MBA9019897.1 pimeloyl-ACP methyl ester carboxylesterase [Aminobacter ciceronei]MBB3706700.1 pimeloyl-ACP methyl ester carboxylesterase [Aminobacter aminovorans]QOF71259.1 alpha/beta fold hydrolase [Aminobacter sp. SR38]
MASIGLKVIRRLFGAAELVSPRLAGRAAFELFRRTPSQRSLTSGERRAIGNASGFMAEARHHRIKTQKSCVAMHEFRPEGASRGTVLVIHGWRSRTEYMQALIEGYRDAGMRVISLDLPGHGGSLGRALDMAKAVEAATLAGQWFGPFEAIVGHSFGGAVAVNAAAGTVKGFEPLGAKRLVLVAAPDSMPRLFDDFGRYLNLGPRTQRAISGQVQRVTGTPIGQFVGSRLLMRLATPTLVIHAPDDREVSANEARAMAGAGGHVRLFWADGLGHRRILSSAKVVAEAVGFLQAARELDTVH